ncbi:hypothetical protein N7486_007382 [Penicillium sp. IBT 16267x]|nr:hypothetical protein N7486_007382 [Penicillium sp. IBT 16267x]
MASKGSPATPSNPKVKQIANSRRLLILAPPTQSVSIIPPLLYALTDVPVHDLPQPEQSTPAEASSSTTPPKDKDIASPTPPDTITSFAGYTTHSPLRLNTKYYSAEIPIWVDEVPFPENEETAPSQTSTDAGVQQWRTEFLSDEAEVVRDAVGALLVCVKNPSETDPRHGPDPASRTDVRAILDLMRDIGAVKERIDDERGGMGGDVSGIFVLVGAPKSEIPGSTSTSSGARDLDEMGLGLEDDVGIEDVPLSASWWEDMLYDLGCIGWEVVEWDPKGQGEKTKNKFGEYEGMPRIKEVLETHDWAGPGNLRDPDAGQELDLDSDDDPDAGLLGSSKSRTGGFGQEVQELEREMVGLRMAIQQGGGDGDEGDFGDFEDGDDEIQVESMEGLMMRVQAIKDMSADLPENERKKFAAQAINALMREL